MFHCHLNLAFPADSILSMFPSLHCFYAFPSDYFLITWVDPWLFLSMNIWIQACFKWAVTIAMKSLHPSGDFGILKLIPH